MANYDLIGYGSGKIHKPSSSDHLRIGDTSQIQVGASQDLLIYHDGTDSYLANKTGALKIATETSGIAVTIGHSTSEVTIADNLTVAGDLIVQGATTTVNTANLLVEDPIIILNKANSSANGQGGIAIENGGSSTDMVFGRVANDTWGVGTKDTSGGSATTLADMTLGPLRVGKLEIDAAGNNIDVDTDLKIVAAADIVLDPTGGDVKVDGNLLPNADNGGALGASGTEWSDLFLHTGGVINFEAGDVTLTHSANLLSIAGGNTRVIRLEVDGANDYIDVDTDLKLVAAADIVLDPGGSDVKVDGNVVPNADDGGTLGSANLNWSDLFIADAGVINLGDDQDVTLTHVADTGLLLNSTRQLQFGDSGTFINQGADGQLDLTSDGQIDLNVGAAGVIVKGTTPKLTIGDAGEEDTFLVFDGNAQDYRIGLDDDTDKLEFGVGATHGATTAFTIDSSQVTDFTANKLSYGGTAILATGAELNIMDGNTSASATTLVDADRVVVNDGGTMKQVALTDLATYVGSGGGASANNALNAPSTITTKAAGDDSDIGAGQVVCIDSNGKISAANADSSEGKSEVIGVATAGISANTSIGSSIHSAWGKVVDVLVESATVINVGDIIYLESVAQATLNDTTTSNITNVASSSAGDDVYRLGYAVEASANNETDPIGIIWMPQFIAKL